ncbi:hypothetical protein ACFFKH_17815 [Micromonospora marina]|uniref:Uncharacterized protein n=1 Tax=Micromonospora marina TaxID=307120 RepID=A0A1C4Z6C8_9ACTN|nr:hypothetical protein [Micromonospora marina]SCF28141.1 hypothetical protein GA0070215_114128 [Micromonospora marina]
MSTKLPSRLVRLLTGLALCGVSVALMVRADLGLASWNVLHQGLADRTGLPMGRPPQLSNLDHLTGPVHRPARTGGD